VTLEQTFINRRDENVSLDCFDHIPAVLECIRSQLDIQLGVQREKFKDMMERSVSGSAGVRFVIDTQRTREWRGVCLKEAHGDRQNRIFAHC